MRARPLPTVLDAAGRTLGGDEVRAVTRVIESGMLSAVWGQETGALEREFAELHGIAHAMACSSGTAALHLAVAAVDPEPGDEIITTPISDFGTVIPILMQNAVPVFADVDSRTGNIDPDSVSALISERTRAIIAVHLFGAPAPVIALKEVARAHGLVLIEDCAQAYLAEPAARGGYVGTHGDIGCFSLQQSKHITAGDGGLVITADADRASRMRLFADKGWPRTGGERSHLFLGVNYRMTELQAAVARVQLRKLPEIVRRRRASAARLSTQVGRLPGLTAAPDPVGHSFWQFPIVVDPSTAGSTNQEYAAALTAEGIPASAGYLTQPLYATPALRSGRTYGTSRFPLTSPPARHAWAYPDGLCPRAERLIAETLLVLPWNENYSAADVDDIASAVAKVHGVFSTVPKRGSDVI